MLVLQGLAARCCSFLELTSEFPLRDAARFFRVARDTTPAVVQHHVLYLSIPQHRMLWVLVCRRNRTSNTLLGATTVEAQCWGVSSRSIRHEVLMLRCLMAFATILTAGQQDATVMWPVSLDLLIGCVLMSSEESFHYIDLHHQDIASKLLKPRRIT
jgi:hypothetical protein